MAGQTEGPVGDQREDPLGGSGVELESGQHPLDW